MLFSLVGLVVSLCFCRRVLVFGQSRAAGSWVQRPTGSRLDVRGYRRVPINAVPFVGSFVC